MRIKLPFEAAVALAVVIVLIWGLMGVGALGKWVESRLSPAAQKALARSIGLSSSAAGIFYLTTFFTVEELRHPVYPGLTVVDLSDAVLSAVLIAAGAAAFAWGRLRLFGVFLALCGGVAIAAKPVFFPLQTTRGYGPNPGEIETFSLDSETHLYFILSGASLFLFGLVLAVLKGKPRTT
jgi:hypothetical protein